MQCVRVFPPTQVSPIHGKYKERIAQEQRKCSQETENNDTGSLWYKLTGRPQPNPFNGFNASFNPRSGSRPNDAQDHQQQASQSGSSSNNGKKIFSADEGEYVDFEVVD